MNKSSSKQIVSKEYGKTIKVNDMIYDILSSMMTGTDSFNGTITELLRFYFKTHKSDMDFSQTILSKKGVKIDLKQFVLKGLPQIE